MSVRHWGMAERGEAGWAAYLLLRAVDPDDLVASLVGQAKLVAIVLLNASAHGKRLRDEIPVLRDVDAAQR